MDAIINRLIRCFPGSFVNFNGEFIANRRANVYFILKDCKTERDVQCKVLEWFSRHGSKSMPFKTKEANDNFRMVMRKGINDFLNTNFTEKDLLDIYIKLGNGIDHQLTEVFVESGFNLKVLNTSRDDSMIRVSALLTKLNGIEYRARTLEQMRGGNDVLRRLLPKIIQEEEERARQWPIRCWNCVFCDEETHMCGHPLPPATSIPKKITDFCSYASPRKEV